MRPARLLKKNAALGDLVVFPLETFSNPPSLAGIYISYSGAGASRGCFRLDASQVNYHVIHYAIN